MKALRAPRAAWSTLLVFGFVAGGAIPAAAHMFIVNPLTGRGVDSWFATHPAIENRLAELQKLEQEWIADGTLKQSGSDVARDNSGASTGPWTGGAKPGPWG